MNKLAIALLGKICQYLEQSDYCSFFRSFKGGQQASYLASSRTSVKTSWMHQGLAFRYSKQVSLTINDDEKGGPHHGVRTLPPTVVLPSDVKSLHILGLGLPVIGFNGKEYASRVRCYLFGYGKIDHLTLSGVLCDISIPYPLADSLTLIDSQLSCPEEVIANLISFLTDETSYENGFEVPWKFKKLIKADIGHFVSDDNLDSNTLKSLIGTQLQVLELRDYHCEAEGQSLFDFLPITLVSLRICLSFEGAWIPYRVLETKSSLPNLVSFSIHGEGKLFGDPGPRLSWTNLDVLHDSMQLENLEISLDGVDFVNIRPNISRMQKLRSIDVYALIERKGGEKPEIAIVEHRWGEDADGLCGTGCFHLKIVPSDLPVVQSEIFQKVLKYSPP